MIIQIKALKDTNNRNIIFSHCSVAGQKRKKVKWFFLFPLLTLEKDGAVFGWSLDLGEILYRSCVPKLESGKMKVSRLQNLNRLKK